MKRREFLNLAGTAAAAAAFAPVLKSCSASGEDVSLRKLVNKNFKTSVLVVGGGPAGVCAAIAAARGGAQVMIVESGGCLGGMATQGLVGPFMTCFDTTGEEMIVRGIFEEIIDEMVKINGAIHPRYVRAKTPYTAWIEAGHDHVTPFEPEAMKFVLDRMTANAGVKTIFHANFVSPVMDGNRVRGAIVLLKSGLAQIDADIVIDCTGDADVAFRSGVSCPFGNTETGGVQPASLFFYICNVDSRTLEADVVRHLPEFRKVNGVSYRALHWWVEKAEAAGEWDIPRKSVNIYKSVKDDEWAVNTTRISNVDATDSESLTAAEIEGRRQVQEVMHFFHKYVPGCKNATLKCSGSTIGIRESRHVDGEEVLTLDNILSAVVPENSILVCSNSADIHGSGGSSATKYMTVEGGRWYGIPFGCLVPKGVEGLLVAGRSLSATSDAAGAVRVMPPVMGMGQAAGTAAALCVKNGCSVRNLDFADLRAALLDSKVFLG